MATPIKKTNLSKGEPISSNQIVWQGPDIPCIGLCNTDTVSTVVYKVAEKICSLNTELDLTTLDLACVIDLCTGCQNDPGFWSLKNILQILLTNDCKLKDLIDSLNSAAVTDNQCAIVLDLSCLEDAYVELCGTLPDVLDLNKVLQIIIDTLCTLKDSIDTLSVQMNELEAQFAALEGCAEDTYTEPFIGDVPLGTTNDSCLNPAPYTATGGTPLILSEHVVEVTDEAICELRTDVGSEADIEETISSQCIEDYIGNAPVIQNATNLTNVLTNNNLIICDLISRVKTIESRCCAPTCDDIRIGFLSTYDSGTNEYTLSFTAGAGTYIPPGFTDCGSTITLTDVLNVSIIVPTLPAGLTNGSDIVIDVTGLDTSGPITVKVSTCFSINIPGNTYSKPTTLSCEDCFGGLLTAAMSETEPSCWTFEIPKESSVDEDWLYYSVKVFTGNAYVETLVTQNDVDGASYITVLPSGTTQCDLDGTDPAFDVVTLKIEGQNVNIPPMVGVRYYESTGPTTYPTVYAVGTLVDPCPVC